jgi:hypothetical protein
VAGCLDVFQNVGYGKVHFAAQISTDSDQRYDFFGSIGGGSGFGWPRLGCGLNNTGQGWGMFVQQTDVAGVFAAVNIGSFSSSPATVRCQMQWAATNSPGSVWVNNVSIISSNLSATIGGPGNTFNTPSDEVIALGYSSGHIIFTGLTYGIVVTSGTSPLDPAFENAIDTYLCTKRGATC